MKLSFWSSVVQVALWVPSYKGPRHRYCALALFSPLAYKPGSLTFILCYEQVTNMEPFPELTGGWENWLLTTIGGKSCACACVQFQGSLRFLSTWNLWMAGSLRRAILTSVGSWHNSVFDDFGSYQNLLAALQWSRMKRMASQGCFSPLEHKWCADGCTLSTQAQTRGAPCWTTWEFSIVQREMCIGA